MFRHGRRVAAAVVLAMALGAVAAAAAGATTDPLRAHRTQTVSADGYYSPNGNAVTWPMGPASF